MFSLVYFQALFHHLFLQSIEDIGTHVVEKGYYSLELQVNGVFLNLYIRFWHAGQLVRVFLKRTGRSQGKTLAELSLVSYVMTAISTRPGIVACLGASPGLVCLLPRSPESFSLRRFVSEGPHAQEKLQCVRES